jgi:APA family basic amino acid/polyamine antiporter
MSASSPTGFQQRLGLFDATMLVAGTMIGSGIFIVSAEISRDLGSSGWLLLIWVLTGLITLAGALSYAELSAMMPEAGGQYVYLRESYSPLFAFLYGWTMFLVIQTGFIAAVAVAFSKFLGVLVPALGTDTANPQTWILFQHVFAEPIVLNLPLPWLSKPLEVFNRKEFTVTGGQLVAVGVIVFLTALNCRGVKEGKTVQNIFTVTKTLALAALIVIGLTIGANKIAIDANTADPWGGATTTAMFYKIHDLVNGPVILTVMMVFGASMVGGLFSADSWNNVTFIAGEMRNPRRNLPLSLFLGVTLVITLYVLANIAYLAALPLQGSANATTPFERGISHAQADRVGTAVLEVVAPGTGVTLMALAILVSTFGCVNGLILMGARLYWAMAQDKLFFRSVGALNNRGVPAAGLALQAVWSIVLLFTGTYNELLDYIIFATLLFYALTVGGLFILRRTRPNAERPYRAFGYPVVPALYVVACVAIMVDLLIVKPVFTWPGLLLVLTGIPVYYLWRLRGASSSPLPSGERGLG